MTAVLWGVVILAVAVALLAARRSVTLQQDLHQLKREQYETSSRVKRIPAEIREAVQPLRLHLAKVATGGTVPRDMILEGRLYTDVTAEEAQRVLDQDAARRPDKVFLVDVRTPKEYTIRRVSGARLVPFDELETRYRDEIPEGAEKVFVYCMGGERSRSVCDFLSLKGYTNLYNIRDGLQGWRGPTEGEGHVTFIEIDRRPASRAG